MTLNEHVKAPSHSDRDGRRLQEAYEKIVEAQKLRREAAEKEPDDSLKLLVAENCLEEVTADFREYKLDHSHSNVDVDMI